MNRTLKSIAVIFVLLGVLLMMSGCYDRVEIEDLGVVRMTGVDWDGENNKYEVTVNVQRPFAGGVSAAKGKSAGSQTPWIASAKGDSIMDATKNLRSRASSSLNWQHSTLIIIGEDMAKQGVDKIIDFFERNREIRYTSYILITKGKASELMKITPETTLSLAEEIDGIIKNSKEEYNKSYVPNLKEFLITLSYKDYDSIVGFIEVVKPIPYSFQEVEEISGIKPSENVVALNGSSIIKNYRLVGWFDETETRGYRWIQGEINRAVIDIFDNDSKMSVEIDKSKSKTSIDIKNNKVFVNIKTETVGHIVQASDKKNFISEDGIKELENLVDEKIKNEILMSINRAKVLDSDIFGFGRKIHNTKPDEWKRISKNWDDYFKEAAVNIEVKTSIKSIGLTSEPITKIDR